MEKVIRVELCRKAATPSEDLEPAAQGEAMDRGVIPLAAMRLQELVAEQLTGQAAMLLLDLYTEHLTSGRHYTWVAVAQELSARQADPAGVRLLSTPAHLLTWELYP